MAAPRLEDLSPADRAWVEQQLRVADVEYRLGVAADMGLPEGIEVFGREEFFTTRWRYEQGEHVTILGPTGSGKTWLAYQALGVTASHRLPAAVLVMKPRDSTVTKWSKTNQFRRVRTWPPPAGDKLWRPKLPGYVLWPPHTFDPDRDDDRLANEFQACLRRCYKQGNWIVFGDEMYGLAEELDLERDVNRLWTRGRSMGTGLWAASQRPAYIPLNAYAQAEHLFIAHDPDARSRKRYDEIGGVDPGMVRDVTARLGRHQFLYIRRNGMRLCVVDK